MYMTMFHSSFYCTTVTGDGTLCQSVISGTIPHTSIHPFESSTWIWPHYYSFGAHHVPQPVCFPNNPQPGFLEQGYFEPPCVDPILPLGPNCDIVAPEPSQESYYGIDHSQQNHYPLQHFQENYFPVNNSLQNDTASKKVCSLTNNNYCPSLETSAFFPGIPIFEESNPIVLYHIPSTDLCYVYVRYELIDGRKSYYLCEGCFLKKKYVLAEVVDDCWFTKDPVYLGHICRPKNIKTELHMRQGTSVMANLNKYYVLTYGYHSITGKDALSIQLQ